MADTKQYGTRNAGYSTARWNVVGFDANGVLRRVSLQVRSETERDQIAARYASCEDVESVKVTETQAEVTRRSAR